MVLQACGSVMDASDPYAFYSMLRERAPLVRAETGQWIVSRHADALALLSDRRFAHWQLPYEHSPFDRLMNRWMSLLDPHSGGSVRQELLELLSPARLDGAVREAGAAAEQCLRDRRSIDVIDDFARPFTLAVAAHFLGVPPSVTDPEETVAFKTFLLFAAHDNMMNFIGNAWLALIRDVDAMARLRSDPSLWQTAIDELLRYDSPVQFISLLSREPVDVGDMHISAGEIVWIAVGSANRDPERFASPDRLVLERRDNGHLSFGTGAMKCIGAHLARLEGRVALEILLRLRGATLAGEVAYRQEPPVLRGAEHIFVEYHGVDPAMTDALDAVQT